MIKIKKLLGLSVCLGSLVLTSNSFAQTALDRTSWSLSTNRNAADTFFAIDDNASTRWTTQQAQRDGQYFEVDFNSTNTFNQVVLDTSGSSNDYPREYELQVSNDGSRWTTVASAEPDASGITTINFSSRTATHIRIEQLGSDNRYWWSIHEMNVFSDASSEPTSSSVAIVNSSFNGENTADLSGQTVRSDVFVSVLPNNDIDRVQFSIDGELVQTENVAPFDLGGTSRSGSNPFDTNQLSNGNHTIVAEILFNDGSSDSIRSIFEVDNSGSTTPTPVPAPTPEPEPNDDLEGLHEDITRLADIAPEEILRSPRASYLDSYSVGDRCYCESNFDHNIVDLRVDTSVGNITVREACDIIGPGPGSRGRPLYNDIQCGNGPANDAGDEDYCPGRVDLGREGCIQIGPKWNFD